MINLQAASKTLSVQKLKSLGDLGNGFFFLKLLGQSQAMTANTARPIHDMGSSQGTIIYKMFINQQ